MTQYIDHAKIPAGYKAHGPLIIDRPTCNHILSKLKAVQDAEKARLRAIADEVFTEENPRGIPTDGRAQAIESVCFDYAKYEVDPDLESIAPPGRAKKSQV